MAPITVSSLPLPIPVPLLLSLIISILSFSCNPHTSSIFSHKRATESTTQARALLAPEVPKVPDLTARKITSTEPFQNLDFAKVSQLCQLSSKVSPSSSACGNEQIAVRHKPEMFTTALW